MTVAPHQPPGGLGDQLLFAMRDCIFLKAYQQLITHGDPQRARKYRRWPEDHVFYTAANTEHRTFPE
jgi:hypothetical protein